MNKFVKYHLPLILYLLFIFVMSSLPGDSIPDVTFEVSDKVVHAAVYFILYFLFQHSLHNQEKYQLIKQNAFLFAFLFTVLYAISDELHQFYVPSRDSDLYDIVADAAGGFIAYLMAKLIIFYKNRKSNGVWV